MKYIDEFRRGETAVLFSRKIAGEAGDRQITLMEVCGTHTMTIARNGIRTLLPPGIRLISGPGCPVCVTSSKVVDQAIVLSRQEDALITTFGDMMKVPGSISSLDREHAKGADIRIVTSTLEALALASKYPHKKIVFLGVGFETTVPTVAAAITEAKKRHMRNFFVLSAHKVMPPAMIALSRGKVQIDGYMCPGHVSTIIGSGPYEPLARDFGIGCVIAGFEPVDILQAVLMLVRQIVKDSPAVEIQYTRAVKPEGNPKARQCIEQVFEPSDAEWRGLGCIPGSGLEIRSAFANHDAGRHFSMEVPSGREPRGCRCGEILQGILTPPQCSLFGKTCIPDNPIGPCMVSSEGTCAAYYKYLVP